MESDDDEHVHNFNREGENFAGRIYTVSSREGEQCYLRTLLIHIFGAFSLENENCWRIRMHNISRDVLVPRPSIRWRRMGTCIERSFSSFCSAIHRVVCDDPLAPRAFPPHQPSQWSLRIVSQRYLQPIQRTLATIGFKSCSPIRLIRDSWNSFNNVRYKALRIWTPETSLNFWASLHAASLGDACVDSSTGRENYSKVQLRPMYSL